MNLFEQIKQKAQSAKRAVSEFINPSKSMSFPTTSEALSKSTQIGKEEEAKGYYGKQDNSIINSPVLGEIKNKLGLNYEDAQVNAWREGLKVNPQLAAKMGNNPALYNVDMTGSMAAKKPVQQITKKVGEEIKPIAKNIFQGFKDLSTKLLEDLKGKSVVPKSYIEQRLVSSDLNLKQVEKDLIRSKLENYPDRLDVNDFAESVKTDLLPLTINKSGTKAGLDENMPGGFSESGNYRYENVSLPEELRGNIQNYAEHIYESPIKTSAGQVHFRGQTENYFGHTRIEDMADSSLDKAMRKSGKTRRVIEVQSDLYQKNNLEKEKGGVIYEMEQLQQKIEKDKELLTGNYDLIDRGNRSKLEIKRQIEQATKNLEKLKTWNIDRFDQVSKLEQYSDPTAHYRMVREEVKKAAIDGKEKLQFPTGETAMKIEGLGDNSNWITPSHLGGRSVGVDDLKIGNELSDGGTSWIITDVLEGGKFKAVPKNATKDAIEEYNFRSEEEGYGTRFNNLSKEEQGEYLNDYLNNMSESFDISGKVDTNNPIYKFYEKDLGKYLKSKFNAREITDERGVKWFELDVKPEFKDKPIEAFGFSTPEQILKTSKNLGIGLGLGTAGLAYKDKLDKMNQETDKRKQELETLKKQLEEAKSKQPKTYDEKLEYVIPRLKVNIDNKGQIKGWGNTLAVENNNPGNLRFAGQPNATQGRGGFAKFETPQLGFRALIKQLQKDQSRDLTLEQFVHKYSPPSENDTKKYIKFLEDKLDVRKSDKIVNIPVFKLAEQVAMFESQTKISF